MALPSCSCGVLATALLALLLLPAHYYVPQLAGEAPPPAPCALAGAAGAAGAALLPPLGALAPPALDAALTAALLALAGFTYLCEWIQRKLMERRIIKLNQYLGASVERLRAWDAAQEQLEATLRMVRNAAAEYNLLLYLMLRQRRGLPCPAPPFDKELDEPFPRGPAAGVGVGGDG